MPSSSQPSGGRPFRRRPPPPSEASFGAWLAATLARKPVHGLRTDRRILFFLLLGGVMGTVLDALHVLNETAVYQGVARIPLLEVAFYVPLEFMAAGFTVGMLRPELDEELSRARSEQPLSHVLAGMGVLAAAWFASGWLTRLRVENWEIAAVLWPVAALCWAAFDRTWQGAVAAVITAGIGVGVEAGLVKSGTYRYLYPDFWGLPLWLPALYMIACVSVGNLGRFMKYSWDRERGEPETVPAERQAA